MNAKEALAEIKNLISSLNNPKQGKFAMVQGKLADGTAISYDLDTLEIYVVGEDGASVPAPVGEHVLESGEVIVVTEEGKIAEVKKGQPEVEVEIEAEDVKKEDAPADAPKEDEAMAKFEEAVSNLTTKVDELSAKVDAMEKKYQSMSSALKLSAQVIEELANQPSSSPIQKPNNFYKEVKSERITRFNNLQQAFQKLKTK